MVEALTLVSTSGVNGDNIYMNDHLMILSDGASGAGREGKVLMSTTCIETAKEITYINEPEKYL